MFKTIRTAFSGKKTYFIGILMILLGICNGSNDLILEGIVVITLRAGISKAVVK